MGRPDDTCSLPQFCDAFLELAGIDHRVEEFDPTGPGAWKATLTWLRSNHKL